MERGILKINPNKKIFLKKIIIVYLALLFLSSCAKSSDQPFGIASRHHLATDIGMDILLEGGNAVDAAVAVSFALAVVNPSAGNIGGGGFMIIHLSEIDETIALDYRERAPIKSFEKMFLDQNEKVIKGLSLNSTLASGVPGTISGMFYASKKFGSMNIEKLISPSIEIARNGFNLSEFQAKNLNKYRGKFLNSVEAKQIFTKPNGFKEGDVLIQKNLANTLERISKNGEQEFYSGETAKKISEFFKENDGILSLEDLRQYKLRVLDPICKNYRTLKICSMPPPSSGGVALIQMLNILENTKINTLGHNSEKYLKLLVSAMDFAYHDRAKFLGDPDYYDVPEELLTSKEYAKKIFKKIQKGEKPPKIEIAISESEETTHFSIIDKWGNVVSNTYTLNTAYGSGIVPTGTGILMNNEMDDFSSKPGFPNAYGLVGSEANKIEPKKTPLSSMTPVIIFKQGRPFLISGSPGGSTIITSVLQEILNVLDFNMSLKESSSKSRIHFQHLPDILFHEELDKDVLTSLKDNKKLIGRKLGEIHSILLKGDNIEAFSDKRRPDGKASTFQK